MILSVLNIITVFFGLYSVKYVNIPIFLTMRRCCILATTIINYFVRSQVPDSNLIVVCFMLFSGSIVAGYESFDANILGYFLIWFNNFFGASYNVFVSKFNEDKKVSAF